MKQPYFIFLFLFAANFAAFDAEATLTPDYPRGESLVTHAVPGGVTETCVIPAHFPDAKYSKKDLEKEKELCSYDIDQTVAACPKLNSSNPGVNFYLPPKGMSFQEFEKKDCEAEGRKKLAKYKLSTSCSYSPALLAYYHVSRILGRVGDVPPAVVRTMDLERHKAYGRLGLAKSPNDDLIHQTWASLMSALEAGRSSSRADLLLTDNYDQSYGALQVNPKGEVFYKEFYNSGKKREEAFKTNNKIYKALQNPTLRIGTDWNADNVQAMVQLRDMSDMILLDTVLGQQDRFGNIHYKLKYFYHFNKKGKYKVDSEGDKEDVPQEALGDAVQAKVLLMKDNDCGVAKENRIKDAQLLDRVSHMDPSTYKRLLKFEKEIDSEDSKKFFLRNLVFTNEDYRKVSRNVHEAAAMLHAACAAGRLKLDLDLDKHFSGEPAKWDCE